MNIGNVKPFIVICVILAVIGGSMMLQKHAVNTQQVAPATSLSNQPAWHQVATYTGPGRVNGTFSIQGSQFKVTMSAVPMFSSDTNFLDVVIGSRKFLVASGTLSWNLTENPDEKELQIPVSKGAGTYDIHIGPKDIQNYTVTVWDYY